jgi:ATP-dependent DNA helicase RecQ
VKLARAKVTNDAPILNGDYERSLLQSLKDVRKQIAAEEGVPPYMILSDATLMEIAMYLPHSRDEFSRINGFGQVKLERYEREFREVVIDYCDTHQLNSRISMKSAKPIRKERPARDSDTKQKTLELFNKGIGIEKIAAMRELTVSTIETHLSFYIQSGKLEIADVLSEDQIAAIKNAMTRTDSTMVSSIKERLGEEYTYGQIRMVLAQRQRELSKNHK